MKKLYLLALLCCLSVVAFATKVYYPNTLNGGSGTASYCQNVTASNVTFQLTNCTTGTGGTSATTNLVVTWYANTINSTSGGTAVSTLTGQSTGTTNTKNFNYVPSTANVGVLYYYVTITWTVVAGACNTTGSIKSTACVPITVNAYPSAIVGTPLMCSGGTFSVSDPSTGGTWSSGTVSVATVTPTANPATISGIANGNSIISYTLNGCAVTAIATVNPTPGTITVTPTTTTTACGTGVQLTATGGAINATSTALSQDFNSGFGTWTTDNTGSSSGLAWTARNNSYNSVDYGPFHSNDNTKFAACVPDDVDDQTQSILISPTFSLAGFSTATLTYYYTYEDFEDTYAGVDISTDGGTTWTNIISYLGQDQGDYADFVAQSYNLSSYIGQANCQIRFKYYSFWGFYWALDNILVSGQINQTLPYTWTPNTNLSCNPCANPIASPASPTVYSVTSTNGTCTSAAASTGAVNVTPAPTAVMSPSVATSACVNQLLTASTDIGDAYQWYNQSGIISGASTSSYTATVSGTYSVKVTKTSTGCNTTSTATVITINPLPTATVSPAGTATACGSQLLTAGTDIGDAYLWYKDGVSTGVTTNTVTATASGSYTVKVTKSSTGCNFTSSATVVTINPLPTASITGAGGLTTICGTSLVLTANTDIGDTYQWMLNGSNVGTSTTTYTATLSGTYTVKITKASTGCNFTSAPVVITINPIPTSSISTAGNVTTICGTSLVLTANTDIGDTYQWMLNGGNVGTNSPNYSATTTGTYTVKITNSATGCNSTSAPVVITINPIPTATIATAGNATQFCRTLLITGTTDIGDKFQWYKDGSVIPSATLSTYTASASGSYYLLVTKLATGCNATSATVVITKNTIPSSYITSALTASCSCITLNANTDINPIGNAQYNWYLNGTSVGGNTATYSACVSGTYTLRMTNTPTGCDSLSLPIVITIYPAVTASISPNTATSACVSQLLTTTTNITPAGNARYQWYNASGAIAGATLAAYTATVTGVYHVVDSNNVTGCYQPSNTVSITINAIPTSAITTLGNITTNCVSLVLTDVTNIGTSWQWYKNGTGAGNIIAGANAQTYTATSTGTYYCKAIGVAPTLCNQFSAGVSITINPAPNMIVNAGGSTTFCSGGSVTLTASSGYTYQWLVSNLPIANATTLSYTATQAGNYRLIESTGLCIDTTTAINVTVNPLPDVTFTLSGPATFCEGSSIDFTALNGYTYAWKLNGATVGNGQTYTATQPGSYSLTATNTFGCSKTSANTVINTIPVPLNTVTLSGPPVFCLGSSVILTADQTGDDYQWQVNGVNVPGATNQSYTQNTSGDVTVAVTGGICSSTSTPIPIVMASPVTTVTYTGSTTFCEGNTVDLNAASGYVYQWDSAGIMIPGAINQILTVSAAGDYKVILANLGCVDSSSNVHITVDSTPVPVILRNNTTFTTQAVYTTYQWFKNGIVIPGATNRNYVATINANYTVFVKDGNSCTATSAIATLDGLSVTNTSEVPVSIYPNPATTTLYIQSQAKLNAYIYSIEGKLIMSKDKATELDLHGLANGTYLIKLTDENGNMVKTARITKSE